jgi:mRNA interferase RelE/StbE
MITKNKERNGLHLAYRLRVGQWCVIFDRNDEVKIIAIEKIKPHGGAYK